MVIPAPATRDATPAIGAEGLASLDPTGRPFPADHRRGMASPGAGITIHIRARVVKTTTAQHNPWLYDPGHIEIGFPQAAWRGYHYTRAGWHRFAQQPNRKGSTVTITDTAPDTTAQT